MWHIGGARTTIRPMANHYGKSAVKASLVHFFFGKALNAVVSLVTLIALARWLTPADYGIYIAFSALQASLLVVSDLGIDTTAERFMPELRMHHSDFELLGFVAAVLCARVGTLFFMVGIGWLFADDITAIVGLNAYSGLFKLWLGVVAFSGLLGLAVVLLESMLHQRPAQTSMSIYVVLKLLLLYLGWHLFTIDILYMVQIELIATCIAALFGTVQLLSHFSLAGLHDGWLIVKKNRQRLQRFAFFNYFAQVVFQLFSAEVIKLMVTRLLGVLQSAVYGFAHSLAETVQRYLPTVLLLRLIKPVFVSRYVKTGDFGQLNSLAQLVLKLNLLILTPTIAFAAVYGGRLLSLISNGKYEEAHWLLVGMLGILVFNSHKIILSLLAGTLEKNKMQLYAGMASSIVFPIALLLIPRFGPLGAIAVSAISGLTYNTYATFYLRKAGYCYQPDLRAATVFLISGILTFLLIFLINKMLPFLLGLFIAVFIGGSFYIFVVRTMHAFSKEEVKILNSLLPKTFFNL